jgi:hypothetical protein
VRVASWVFVLCAALAGAGVFLPAIELRLQGSAVSKRTTLSLYKIASDRQLARRFLVTYRHSAHRRIGAEIVRSVTPHMRGRTGAALAQARDAMDALDDVSDDDVRTAGIVLIAALCALIGLDAIMVGLVFGELIRGSYRRGRHVAALLASLAVTALAIALHVVCREAVWEANNEVSRTVLTLGPGAYVIPAAAVAAFFTAIVLVARRRGDPARVLGRRAPRR